MAEEIKTLELEEVREPAQEEGAPPSPPASVEERWSEAKLVALRRFIEFQNWIDEVLKQLVPPDSIRWVESKKDGTKKPVLEKHQYAKIARVLGLTEVGKPEFKRYEIGREVVFECTTCVEWPAFGTRAWGVGSAATDGTYADTYDRRIHDARGKAHTRAWERAISNLVGLGALGDEEVAGHPELVEVSPALKFVLELATKKGISKDELREYVAYRWQGEALERLPTSRVVVLKKVVEQVKSKEDWQKECARWNGK